MKMKERGRSSSLTLSTPSLIGNNKRLYLSYMHTRSGHFSSAALVERIKAASLRDEAAYFHCHFERSRIGRMACCWLKRRITRGGISVLISPPREAISLRGQRRGLPIIQGQGGGNGEG